jgi:hypothetical protein
MNVNSINERAMPPREVIEEEKPPVTVQNELQKEVIEENKSGKGSTANQNQTLSVISATQPQEQIQQTAKNQISKGYLDVKV